MTSMDYRTKFYEKYAETVQIQPRPLTPAEADRWASVYSHFIRGWLPSDRNAAIVDLACGAGKLLRFFASRGYTNVRGVDISPQQIELARHLHPHVEQANILEYLAERQNTFDLITGIDVIEHLTKEEILVFMDRCHAALRPGGRLILQTPNGESLWCGENWHGDFTHRVCLNPKSMGQLFSLCGLTRYEPREMGPVPHGLISCVRYVLWRMLRLALIACNLIETGTRGSGVFTRVFIASGVKA